MIDYFLSLDYLDEFKKNQKERIQRLGDPNFSRQKVEIGFQYTDIPIAKHYICTRNLIPHFKGYLFTGGLVWNYINETYNSDEEYWLGADTLAWILMCDNQELYKIMYKNCKYFYQQSTMDRYGSGVCGR
ncbi:MAG: hypothetical protein IPM26_05230 [Saprospiraceae bacterium]|nr:hypothetical protein [Saprospiraceae bacterium]